VLLVWLALLVRAHFFVPRTRRASDRDDVAIWGLTPPLGISAGRACGAAQRARVPLPRLVLFGLYG